MKRLTMIAALGLLLTATLGGCVFERGDRGREGYRDERYSNERHDRRYDRPEYSQPYPGPAYPNDLYRR